MTSVIPRVGQWLYSTCAAENYGQITRVGADANGAPVLDVRIADLEALNQYERRADGWANPLTRLVVPAGTEVMLVDVQYRMQAGPDPDGSHLGTLEINGPVGGCYRCTRYFWLRDE